MKHMIILTLALLVAACDASPQARSSREAAKAQALGGNSGIYEAFEVKEFGLVCVASIRAISCVNK